MRQNKPAEMIGEYNSLVVLSLLFLPTLAKYLDAMLIAGHKVSRTSL